MFIERLVPRNVRDQRQSRSIFPASQTEDLAAAGPGGVDAAARGELSLDKARAWMSLLAEQRAIIEAAELALRLEVWSRAHAITRAEGSPAMKLLRRLLKMETAQAAACAAAAEPVALVWTSVCERVDRELGPGEYLAVDVHITGACGEIVQWRTVERVTRDENDRGRVYDREGVDLGAVTSAEGPYVTLDVEDAVLGRAAMTQAD